jgi:hypothetical protein
VVRVFVLESDRFDEDFIADGIVVIAASEVLAADILVGHRLTSSAK